MIIVRSGRFKKQFRKLVKKDKRLIRKIEKTLHSKIPSVPLTAFMRKEGAGGGYFAR